MKECLDSVKTAEVVEETRMVKKRLERERPSCCLSSAKAANAQMGELSQK